MVPIRPLHERYLQLIEPTTISRFREDRIDQLLAAPQVLRAFKFFENNAAAITREQIAISSIPAPPFKESQRAEYLSDKFLRTLGLVEVEVDKEGNSLGLRRGDRSSHYVVVSVHLDTVLPEGTDVTVRSEQGNLLRLEFPTTLADSVA